jgi:hypothetical protein
MNYSFHPEAEAEFLEAIAYYAECEEGLGHDFAAEVYAAVRRVLAYPRAWPIIEGEVGRCQTKRFPYGVLYCEEAGIVFILAAMHLHRHPDYWKHRLA